MFKEFCPKLIDLCKKYKITEAFVDVKKNFDIELLKKLSAAPEISKIVVETSAHDTEVKKIAKVEIPIMLNRDTLVSSGTPLESVPLKVKAFFTSNVGKQVYVLPVFTQEVVTRADTSDVFNLLNDGAHGLIADICEYRKLETFLEVFAVYE